MPAQVLRRPRFLEALPAQREVQVANFLRSGSEPSSAPPLRRVPTPQPEEGGQPSDEACISPPTAMLPRASVERLSAAIDLLKLQAEQLAERARSDALEIGFQVAHRILEAELHSGPEALFALVRSALRKAGASRRVTIRVRPEDLAQLQGSSGAPLLAEFSAAQIELKSDPSLASGDVVVDTDFGTVDGRLTSRLAELRRAIDLSVPVDASALKVVA